MFKKLMKWLCCQEASGKTQVQVEKKIRITDSVDRTMEAITFAEAGVHQVARDVILEQQRLKCKILVVGHGEHFSKAVVDYALGCAGRMDYEIIALNVIPLSRAFSPAPYCTRTDETLLSEHTRSIATFHHLCKEKGIAFTHIVKVGDMKRCIRDVYDEVRRIHFVVSEPEDWPKLAKDRFLTRVAVFSPAYQ